MSERCISALNDDRYVAVGDLVVRAAQQAQAELGVIQKELFKATLLGHATVRALEAREAKAASDAAILDAMATHVLPSTNGDGPALNGGTRALGRPETAASNGSPTGQPERIRHRDRDSKERFEERAFPYLCFMVSQGGVVEAEDGVTPLQFIRDGVGMSQDRWGNFSIRLRQVGLLTLDRNPGTKRYTRAYLDREWIASLIERGDLPSEWADELAKLDQPDSTELEPPVNEEEAEATESEEDEDDEYEPVAPPTHEEIARQQMQKDFQLIHARNSKPARRRNADLPQKRRLGRF